MEAREAGSVRPPKAVTASGAPLALSARPVSEAWPVLDTLRCGGGGGASGESESSPVISELRPTSETRLALAKPATSESAYAQSGPALRRIGEVEVEVEDDEKMQ